jgi:DNA-binding transcriptional LysR family regulator
LAHVVGFGIKEFVMDLRYLRSFVAVAEELSFCRAAKRLHISQPPLSRQIAALEAELGVRLLERGRFRRVSLTDAGKSFLTDARLALASATAARGRAQDAARDARGQLKLGNMAGLSTRVLPHLLHAFRKQSPEVEVSLVEMNRPQQLTALRERRIHAGIFPDLGAPLDRHFQSMPLYSCPMVAVFPSDHALAREAKDSIKVNRLAGQTLVIASPETSPGYIERLNNLCVSAKFTPTATHAVEGAANVLCMVSAGYGVAILPEVVATSFMQDCRTRPLRAPVPPFRLKLLWLRDAGSPLLQNFLVIARQWAREAATGNAPRRRGA